jgi:hypothetical protein
LDETTRRGSSIRSFVRAKGVFDSRNGSLKRRELHLRTVDTDYVTHTAFAKTNFKNETYGFVLAWGLRGAGTSQRIKGPNLIPFQFRQKNEKKEKKR